MSVKEVVTYHTYQNGRPVRGGLNDPALGVIDKRATCTTCKNTYGGSGGINDCPGHFGHVQVRCMGHGRGMARGGWRPGRGRARRAHGEQEGEGPSP
jgi:hypothetical protein